MKKRCPISDLITNLNRLFWLVSGLNPNRSLDRLLYPFSLFKVCLCHISISLCSMTLLGLGRASKLSLLSLCVTFGILSTSLSRRSPLRLRWFHRQSSRNKYHSDIKPNDRFGLKNLKTNPSRVTFPPFLLLIQKTNTKLYYLPFRNQQPPSV